MTASFIAICKTEYVPIVSSEEEVIPGNIGALKLGLEALGKEDAEDYTRANQLWAQAKALLLEEKENDEGAGSQGRITVEDDFDMAGISGNTITGWEYPYW